MSESRRKTPSWSKGGTVAGPRISWPRPRARGARGGGVGDERERAEAAELVEGRDRRRAVDLLADPEGPLRLLVGLPQRRQRPRRPAAAGGQRLPHARSRAAWRP